MGDDSVDQTFPLVACRPVNPGDYPPEHLALWNEVLRGAGGREPLVYPGSVTMSCGNCQIAIHVGPRQQKLILTEGAHGHPLPVLCVICCMLVAREIDADEITTIDLGSKHQPSPPV